MKANAMSHRGALIVRKAWTGALKCALAILFMLLPAFARDNGQWENADPVISGGIRGLMHPDNTRISCCGTCDTFWEDGVEIKDGQDLSIDSATRVTIP